MDNNTFFTIRGYKLKSDHNITDAMEDYLEMICRFAHEDGYMRVSHLASMLNVKPSSASKMVTNLKALGYVSSERYGIVTPTEKGSELGEYLLSRHAILNRFLCLLNRSEDETEQVEQIEHFLDTRTIENLARLVEQLSGG